MMGLWDRYVDVQNSGRVVWAILLTPGNFYDVSETLPGSMRGHTYDVSTGRVTPTYIKVPDQDGEFVRVYVGDYAVYNGGQCYGMDQLTFELRYKQADPFFAGPFTPGPFF